MRRSGVQGILARARNGFLLLCALSLFGGIVIWGRRNPETTGGRVINAFAGFPGDVTDLIANLGDPFEASHVPDEFRGQAGFVPLVNHTRHRIEGALIRRGPAPALPGVRLLQGLFRIDGATRYAVLALSADMAVEKVWIVGDDMLAAESAEIGQAPYPHGLALLADGSMLFAFDGRYAPLRIDPCGRRVWASETLVNHAISPTDDGRFAWGAGDKEDFKLISLADGRLARRIAIDAIRAANPEATMLAMRRIDVDGVGANPRDAPVEYLDQPFHLNDVEPLPAALADAFPQFAAGDLLMSLRSLNLIMVVDPKTLRIKWHANDATLRQHDPDWQPDGTITALDNRMGEQFSRIVRFDPSDPGSSSAPRVDLKGQDFAFYTNIRGKHQFLPDGSLLISSSQQGRAFERAAGGKLAFEILARDPSRPGSAFVLSEAAWFAADSSSIRKAMQCPAS